MKGFAEFRNKYIKSLCYKPCVTMSVDWVRAKFVYNNPYHDYVRYSSLELVAREIYKNKIAGNVAELGVFRADFARCINLIFPDRKLYLFDTFAGFDNCELENEQKQGLYTPDKFVFKDTTVNLVLSKMKHKNNCVIKQGYFPETAYNIEDTFAFVSIDVDLSESTYNGLCWFYPRMEKGGYIFVHDFNNKKWTGAKVGVEKFVAEFNASYFPLSDKSGSVVFVK